MISLKVHFSTGATKVMRFPTDIPIREILSDIQEKAPTGGADHGLYQPAIAGKNKARWFKENHTLKFYDNLRADSEVYYRKKHRAQKIKLYDGTLKTVIIDDSSKVGDILNTCAKKLHIKNPTEYGIRLEGSSENAWLNEKQTLQEQDINLEDDDVLIFAQKLFGFSDEHVDSTDPQKVHMLYVQMNQHILDSKYPTTKEEASELAALQVQIEYGNHDPSRHKPKFLKLANFVPKQFAKNKDIEKEIYSHHKNYTGMSEVNAKFRYIQLVRSLKTYGLTFFEVKEKATSGKKKGKLIPVLIGIARDRILKMDYDTKEIIIDYPLIHLKQWAAARDKFTFDFGDHYQDSYYTVQSPEAVQMSQLISSYIEAIIEERNNAMKTGGNDDEGNQASITDAPPTQVGSSYSQSPGVVMAPGVGGLQRVGSAMPQATASRAQVTVVPESQKINIRDMRSARRVANLLNQEIGEDIKLVGNNKNQNVSKSNLTEEQWGSQLKSADKDVSDALSSLMQCATCDPSKFNKDQLEDAAKMLGNELLKLTKVAKGAGQLKKLNTQSAMLTAAQRAASAAGEMFDLCERIVQNPYDDKAKAQLKAAERKFKEATLLLLSAQADKINDEAAETLISESAKALVKHVGDVISCARDATKGLTDGTKMRAIHLASKDVASSRDQFEATIGTLASAVLNPSAKQHLIDASQGLAGLCASLCSTVKDSGAAPQFLQSIGIAAKNVNDSILRLVNSVDCAEEGGLGGLDFQGPADRVATSIGEMRVAGTDKQKLLDAVKMCALATNELVANAKKVGDADVESRERIHNTANRAADCITKMVEEAKSLALNPQNASQRQKLLDAAGRVQAVSQEIVVDAGKTASVVNLRHAAKLSAAAATNLIEASYDSLPFITNEQQKQKLADDAKECNNTLLGMLQSIQKASQNANDMNIQNELLDNLTQSVGSLANTVASAKVASFNVSDANKKQALQYSANEMGDSLRDLMKACEEYNAHEGHKEIEEALQTFDANNSSLDAADFRASSGLLKPQPGQSRDAAKALLEKSFQALSEGGKSVITAAKGEGGQLGPACKQAAEACTLISTAIEAVAATTPLQAQQRRIISSGKKLNNDVGSFISSARAYSSKRDDIPLAQALAKSYQQLKGSIASVLAAASGLDSSELDEAVSKVNKAAETLERSSSPSLSYEDAINNLTSNAKALSAAASQLTSVAKSNPGALSTATKIVASTCDDIVKAAGEAAGHADPLKGDNIISSSKALLSKITELFQAAKYAVATKTNEASNNLDNAAVEVASASSDLLGSLSGTENPQVQFASNQILSALSSLDDFNIAGKGVSEVVSEIERATSNLAGNSSRLARAAKVGTDKVGIYAKETATDIIAICDVARAATQKPETDKSIQLSEEAQGIKKATDQIISNPGNMEVVVPATKQCALTAAQMMKQGKELAAQNHKNKPSILRAAKALITSTTQLAKAARSKDQEALVQTAKELLENTMALEKAKLGDEGEDESQVPKEAADSLISAAKVLATSANNFLNAVSTVTLNPKDSDAAEQLTAASRQYADSIKDLYRASQSLNPNFLKCKDAQSDLQQAIGDFDQTAFSLSVGSLNPQISGGKSFNECQELLVSICQSVSSDINTLSTCDPKEIGSLAENISQNIRKLVSASRATVATSNNPDLNNKLLDYSKKLAESLLNLVTEVSDPDTDTKLVARRANDASSAVADVLGSIQESTVTLKDLENAINETQNLRNNLGKSTSTREYREIKEEIATAARQLTTTASSLSSIGKSNPSQVTLQAKALSNVLDPVIELANEAMAVSTNNSSKANIQNATNDVITAICKMMEASKDLGANPNNENNQDKLQQTHKEFVSVVPKFLNAIKEGDEQQKIVEEAINAIQNATNELSSSAIFAQAGQLEVERSPKPLTTLVNDLTNVAKTLADSTQKLHTAPTMKINELATSIKQVSDLTTNLSKTAIALAGKTNDTSTQQNVLAAAQASAIIAQQAVLAAQDANRSPNDNTAVETLVNAIKTSEGSLEELTNVVQASASQAQRGERELDSTTQSIKLFLADAVQDSDPNIRNVVSGAKKTVEAVAGIIFSTNQDDLVNGAKKAEEGISQILSNLSSPAPDQDTGVKLLHAARSVANNMMALLQLAKEVSEDPSKQNQIQSSADDVTLSLNELISICNKYPELAGSASLAEDDLDIKAEKQLLDAAEMIKRAAQELALAPIPQIDENNKSSISKLAGTERLRINEAEIARELIDAARQVTKVTGDLMEAAVVAQNERSIENKGNTRYKNDPTWANGLISASKNVAGGVTMLVRCCNSAVKNEAEEEAIIATVKAVAAATAQLVAASRVRANPNSKSQLNLDNAAKGVARATDELVKTAKKQTEILEQIEEMNAGGAFGMTGNMIQKLEQQMAILRLEKQLEQARKNYSNINKSEYDN